MATVKSTSTWASAHALWSRGAMLVSLLMVAFAANDRDPNESIGKVIRTPVTYWFTGTVFDYDAKLGATQCLADSENCSPAEQDYEKLVEQCKIIRNQEQMAEQMGSDTINSCYATGCS